MDEAAKPQVSQVFSNSPRQRAARTTFGGIFAETVVSSLLLQTRFTDQMLDDAQGITSIQLLALQPTLNLVTGAFFESAELHFLGCQLFLRQPVQGRQANAMVRRA